MVNRSTYGDSDLQEHRHIAGFRARNRRRSSNVIEGQSSGVKFAIACTITGIAGLIVSYAFWGNKGLFGMVLGLGGTGFSMIALWGILAIAGKSIKETAQTDGAAIFAAVAFLMKLPIWAISAMIAQKAGGPTLNCFLGGIALVYSCIIGLVLASSRDPK